MFTYGYDEAQRLHTIENPLGEVTTYGYDDASRQTSQQSANGMQAFQDYDTAGRMEWIRHEKADTTVLGLFTYTYDHVGNRTVVEELDAVTTYGYDATYRLTGEHRTGPSSYQTTHTYDGVGNRLVEATDGSLTTFSYDEANQLTTSLDPAAVVTTYSYDGAGNLTSQNAGGDVTANTWNDDNRLTRVVLPTSATATMLYNADGLRVRKEEGIEVVKNIWDFQNLLLEADGADVTQALYTLAPQTYGTLVSQRRGATSHFVLADALGSVVGLSNASQSVSDSYRYKAYGLPLITTGSTTNPFRWVGTLGYYYDASSGRYYVRARHYGPVIARWLSEDPIGFEGSQWNLYEYVNSLPTNGVDPAGNLTINYIPGRLALIDATIVPNNFPKLSSAFDVAWRVNNAAFWTTIDCERRKLCDEIGIFQIVKGSANQTGWGVPLLGTWASLNYSWQIDSIDPDPAYGQPSSKLGGVVRGDPTEIKILSAEDVPGVDPGRPVFYGQYLNFYSLHAETYPVCLKGIEGPKFEAIEGPFIFGTRISSVTVYGPGVTWYHSFTLKGTKWKADRRVTSKNARPGGNFREALQKWFDKFWYVVT